MTCAALACCVNKSPSDFKSHMAGCKCTLICSLQIYKLVCIKNTVQAMKQKGDGDLCKFYFDSFAISLQLSHLSFTKISRIRFYGSQERGIGVFLHNFQRQRNCTKRKEHFRKAFWNSCITIAFVDSTVTINSDIDRDRFAAACRLSILSPSRNSVLFAWNEGSLEAWRCPYSSFFVLPPCLAPLLESLMDLGPL